MPQPRGKGYRAVRLCRAGNAEQVYVHDLVATVFLGSRPENHVVHHENDRRHDNRARNLDWVTQSENLRRSLHRGRAPGAKLTLPHVLWIRRWGHSLGVAELSRRFGVTPRTILRVLRRETWKDC